MVSFPNCKINLGLNIIRKRDDGFHDLETLFYPVAVTDALEVITTNEFEGLRFTSSGIEVSGENLCIKAYELITKNRNGLPGVQMHLHKSIPLGAGLGGGSADAAFALKLLNEKLSLNLSAEQLHEYALHLGSDCPFFLINKPSLATGRGEILKPVEINLSTYQLIIVNPGIHINTAWAFSQIRPAVPKKSITAIVQQPIETWKEELKNDFEEAVFAKHPEIKSIKEKLYDAGALYSAMSGSGSSVYGIFKKDSLYKPDFPADYFVKII